MKGASLIAHCTLRASPLSPFSSFAPQSQRSVLGKLPLSAQCVHIPTFPPPSIPEESRRILCIIRVYTAYTLYYLSIHDVYSVLSEYTRRILTLPPRCIPNRRIPMYTHPQIFPITPNPSLRHSYNCQFRPLAHSELVIKSDNI